MKVKGRFTLVFLSAPNNEEAQVELTYNWNSEDYDEGAKLWTSSLLGDKYLRNLSTFTR